MPDEEDPVREIHVGLEETAQVTACSLHIIEYVQETLARRNETLTDAASERGRRR